jgi:hypothetical protein
MEMRFRAVVACMTPQQHRPRRKLKWAMGARCLIETSEKRGRVSFYVLRLSGTLPPLSASLVMTSLCSQTFIFAEPSSLPV